MDWKTIGGSVGAALGIGGLVTKLAQFFPDDFARILRGAWKVWRYAAVFSIGAVAGGLAKGYGFAEVLRAFVGGTCLLLAAIIICENILWLVRRYEHNRRDGDGEL